MDISNLHESLNGDEDMRIKRDKLVLYLKDCTAEAAVNIQKRKRIAYHIAGIMSSEYAKSLASSDPIDEILVIAGEIEVESDGVALDVLWRALMDAINVL